MADLGSGDARSSSAHVSRLRHELRTPLNAVIGYTEMLLEVAEAGSAFAADVNRIHDAGLKLLSLVNHILEANRFDGTVIIDAESIAAELQRELREPLGAVTGYSDMLLDVADEEGPEGATADLDRIRTAGLHLRALVDDALEFFSPDARGADAEHETAMLALPLAEPSLDADTGRKPEIGHLLVVDDVETNRDLLSHFLQRRGHRVSTAGGGREALDRLLSERVDLVMLDIRMPGMNGYEVVKAMQADARLRAIPVIFISSVDGALGKVRAFRAGGVDFITKPFQSDEVVVRVENQLKLSRLQRELEQQNRELVRKNDELTQAQRRTDLVFSALAEVLPGTVLDGKYKLEDKIGSGGFGAVYRATHLNLNRPVAVKVFRPIAGNDNPEALKRFLHEGASASRVNHPNAVAVLDSGITAAGIAYLVMELLEGASLTEELRRRGALTLSRAVAILLPVCDALAEAHASGIVHRDIKPDNIFLHRDRGEEVVKVVDFGLAKALDDVASAPQHVTVAGSIIGTPAYMAPERLYGTKVDGRADIYSLGVVIYQMLVGRLPFQTAGADFYAVMMQMMANDCPPSVREVNPSLPPEVDEAVCRALAKDPAARPTARELGEMIRGLAAFTAEAPAVASQDVEDQATLHLPPPQAE